MDNTNKILAKIAGIVGDFLMDNGGMSNGYQTYAHGTVYPNVTGTLTINVNNDNLTKNQLNKLASTLEQKIKNFLIKENFSYPIKISKRAMEWGTYDTLVSLTEEIKVVLYK